jgi:hypothetical protein
MSVKTENVGPQTSDASPAFEGFALRCPACGGAARLEPAAVKCIDCDTAYPVRNTAIDFMGPYRRAGEVDADRMAAATDAIMAALQLPERARPEVEEAVAASADRTGVAYVDAEIAALPSRFGAENFSTVDPGVPRTDPRRDLSLLQLYGPPSVAAGSRTHRSVRVRAERRLTAEATGLAYAWHRGRLARLWQRSRIAARRRLTRLPIDLEAGRELSLSVALETPRQPGDWTLSLIPVVDGRSRPAQGLDVAVRVHEAAEPSYATGELAADYGADHLAAIRMLQDDLAGAGERKLLEVAAGASPHLVPLAADGHTVVASDVCANQMRLGAVYCRHNMPHLADRLGYAAFDAFDPPFQPAQFGGVAMFSALHHFPDPVAFLANLAPLVRSGGFVAVLCEPADPDSVGEDYLRDLRAGINEQVFTPAEYLWMIERAGLRPDVIRDDSGSLKVIARRP